MSSDCNVDHPVAALTDITRLTEIVSEIYNNNNNNNTQVKTEKVTPVLRCFPAYHGYHVAMVTEEFRSRVASKAQ